MAKFLGSSLHPWGRPLLQFDPALAVVAIWEIGMEIVGMEDFSLLLYLSLYNSNKWKNKLKKILCGCSTVQESVPLTHALFKGQLYFQMESYIE